VNNGTKLYMIFLVSGVNYFSIKTLHWTFESMCEIGY
jgi:hypothetical protein